MSLESMWQLFRTILVQIKSLIISLIIHIIAAHCFKVGAILLMDQTRWALRSFLIIIL